MKIKPGFVLREMCGEKIVSAEGLENFDFNKLITLNETAAYLWNEIQDKEFDENTLAKLLTDRYDISEDIALKDATTLCNRWKEIDII